MVRGIALFAYTVEKSVRTYLYLYLVPSMN
jgi:hypothetical protein